MFEDHVIKIKEVFGWFSNKRFLLKLKKCKFYQTKIEFLRYIIRWERIYMNLTKIKAILEWFILINIKEIQRFLGFINFN